MRRIISVSSPIILDNVKRIRLQSIVLMCKFNCQNQHTHTHTNQLTRLWYNINYFKGREDCAYYSRITHTTHARVHTHVQTYTHTHIFFLSIQFIQLCPYIMLHFLIYIVQLHSSLFSTFYSHFRMSMLLNDKNQIYSQRRERYAGKASNTNSSNVTKSNKNANYKGAGNVKATLREYE